MCLAFPTLSGPEEFPHELPAVVVERVSASRFGSDRQEIGEQKTQHVALEETKRLGWEEDDVPQRRKGNQQKVMTARRLRQETTMTQNRIAQRLETLVAPEPNPVFVS